MKAVVLAAGLGTRLRPYTDILPKPVFPVLGIPSVVWALAGLRQAGVTQAVINLHHLPGAIKAVVGDGSGFGLRVSYSFEPEILGTGGALVAARRHLDLDEPFLLHNADIFNDWELGRLSVGGGPALAVTDGPRFIEGDRRVELDPSGRVAALRGLPVQGNGRRVVYGGVALLEGNIIDRLARSMPGYPSRLSKSCLIADALIPMLAEGQTVASVRYDSRWYCDTGTPESYLDLNFRALADVGGLLGRRGFPVPDEIEPGIFVAAGARVGRGVRFAAPAMVCAGADIGERSTVGPRAVVSGRTAPGTVVTDSVVMADAGVSGRVSGIVVPEVVPYA